MALNGVKWRLNGVDLPTKDITTAARSRRCHGSWRYAHLEAGTSGFSAIFSRIGCGREQTAALGRAGAHQTWCVALPNAFITTSQHHMRRIMLSALTVRYSAVGLGLTVRVTVRWGWGYQKVNSPGLQI